MTPMAGITGMGDTFDLPNFVGELFQITPADTPLLSAIGGLTGGRPADATLFQWQTFDLRAGSASRQQLEGANAPTAEARVRANVTNVVEIHQEAVDISYTKMAATGQYNSTGSSHPGSVGIGGSNPVVDEKAWQITQALKSIALDVELSFISGTFNNPATNASARRTRGILQAITTNVVDGSGAALTEDMVLDLMQAVWTSGGIMESETATLMCNAYQKRQLTDIFITQKNYQEASRNVAGVRVTTIETDFGVVNIMLNRHMPTTEVAVLSLDEMAPRFLPIPGKGFLFQEDLAKIGASDRTQIYGEIGLEYGLESHHGKISDLSDGTGS
jgi:hypothetical protein